MYTTDYSRVGFAWLLLAWLPLAAQAMFEATVQPIQMCNAPGTTCANAGFSEAQIDAIFAQADLDIEFLPTIQVNDSDLLDVDVVGPGFGGFVGGDDFLFNHRPGSVGTSTGGPPLHLWFVRNQSFGFGNAAVAINGVGGNGAIVGNPPFLGSVLAPDNPALNSAIAHLLGHNFGLGHVTDPDNLMNSPVLANLLTAAQIQTIQGSQFVSLVGPGGPGPGPGGAPEPSSFFLLILGLLGFSVLRNRRLANAVIGVSS